MAISGLTQGLAGMQSSQRGMVDAANRVARTGAQDTSGDSRGLDLVEPLIDMKRQEQLFTASAKVVSIVDKTLGSLIDVTS